MNHQQEQRRGRGRGRGASGAPPPTHVAHTDPQPLSLGGRHPPSSPSAGGGESSTSSPLPVPVPNGDMPKRSGGRGRGKRGTANAELPSSSRGEREAPPPPPARPPAEEEAGAGTPPPTPGSRPDSVLGDSVRNMSLNEDSSESCANSCRPPPPPPAAVLLPESGGRCTLGTPITVRTNTLEFELPPRTPVYRYEVAVCEKWTDVKGKVREKDLAKGAASDYFYLRNKELAYAVWYVVANMNTKFFKEFHAYAYDRARMLYCVRKLPKEEAQFHVTLQQCEAAMPFNDVTKQKTIDFASNFNINAATNAGFDFKLKLTTGTFTLDDVSGEFNRNLVARNRTVSQYLDVLTNQAVFYNFMASVDDRRKYHVLSGNRQLVEKEPRRAFGRPDASHALMHMGVAKSCRAVGLTSGVPGITLSVDVSCMALFKQQNVMAMLGGRPPAPHQVKLLRDLALECRQADGTRYAFICDDISKLPASAQRMTEAGGGAQVVVADYYRYKLRMPLNNPSLPLAVEKRRGGAWKYMPLELCTVGGKQRISLLKQTGCIPRELLMEVKDPQRRQTMVKEAIAKCGFTNDNPFFKAVGVRVSAPVDAAARLLPKPTAVRANPGKGPMLTTHFGGDGALMKTGKQHFFENGKYDNLKWGITVVRDGHNGSPCIDERQLQHYIGLYLARCKEWGAPVPQPYYDACGARQSDINECVRQYAAKGYDYVQFVTHSANDDTHYWIKLAEQQCGALTTADRGAYDQRPDEALGEVVTQHVTVEKSMGKVLDGRGLLILNNYVKKMHTKLGYINYVVDARTLGISKMELMKKVLIGFDVSHAPPLTVHQRRVGIKPSEPSVVGFCANMGDNPYHFVGDFRYQAPRKEICDTVLEELIGNALTGWQETNARKAFPEELWIFRDGVSEGHEQNVIDEEVPAVRRALKAVGATATKLHVVLVLKRHHNRFWSLENNPVHKCNAWPGTVVDAVLTRDKEFYLLAHKAIQGTAKTPRYRVIYEDTAKHIDEYISLAYVLCHAHQIVDAAVSLPEPIYAAHELAKRGKKIYLASKTNTETSGVSTGNTDASDDDDVSDDAKWAALNDTLTYKSKKAAGSRKFWA